MKIDRRKFLRYLSKTFAAAGMFTLSFRKKDGMTRPSTTTE